MHSATRTRARYDWKACLIAVVTGLAVAIPAGLVVTQLFGSLLLLTAVVTLVGTGVSRWTYARVSRPGSRPIEDDACPR
jgi:hypothetical protein